MSAVPADGGLRVLADDLTGALDTAAVFAGEVPVYFDAAPADAPAVPVSAVATATRDVPPATLDAALAPGIAWLAQAGLAFKKVDSLLRGNSFEEVKRVARAGGFARIVLAPAFPQQGRLTLGGRLALADGSAPPTGAPDLRAALADAGLPVWVPDVRSDADLLAIAREALDPQAARWLWCGSAGLARALATVRGQGAVNPEGSAGWPAAVPADAPAHGLPQPDAPAWGGAGATPRLLVSASHHPVSRAQWQRLRAARPQARMLPEGCEGDEPALAELLQAWASASAQADPGQELLLDLSPRRVLSADEAAQQLARQLAAIARQLPRLGVLAVVGGDTLRGLCRATGAQGLLAMASARSGWGQARWLGGPWQGLTVHARSGAFGPPDDLLQVLHALSAPA